MSNRKLYQETFSQVRSHADVRWETYARRGRRRRLTGRVLVLAAVLCALTVLSAAAVAVNLWGLGDLLLPRRETVGVLDGDGFAAAGQTREADTIGLSGYLDAPESRALAEWQAFLADYDPDGAILGSVGNQIDGALWEAYPCYPAVYTWEMGEKLEEIAEAYGLTLHSRQAAVETREDWIALAGGDFLGDSAPSPGWMYEDGTFHFDGDGYAPAYGVVDFQFDRMVKGGFNDVTLNVGDVSAYAEWQYRTACGVAVSLALGPDKALVLAGLEDSFVTLNVLAGTDQGLTADALEAFADGFDFSLLQPARPLGAP